MVLRSESRSDDLVGRQREIAALNVALAAAREGKGGILLVAGEAGAGKTRLVERSLAQTQGLVLTGRASASAAPPYGPVIAALRNYLRQVPDGLAKCGSLAQYLPLILPELGIAPTGGDRAALIAAINAAFETIAAVVAQGLPNAYAPPDLTVVFFDDLQWADSATFELLPKLAETAAQLPLLIIGTYRSDEIPRGHAIRQLRTELRRQRQLQEIAVEPLDRGATAELAGRILGQNLSPALGMALFNRTQGIPLFIEELTHALSSRGDLRAGKAGLELVSGQDVPIPETLRDAVLLRLDGLSAPARKLLEVGSVLGVDFDLALACELACESLDDEEAADVLIERNWITEVGLGHAAFRHALTHEAIYNQIPWTRRRTWHRDIAARLTELGKPPEIIAEHWLAAREHDLARRALLEFAEISCQLHAYRDAAHAMQRVLDLWPKGIDEHKRLEVLERLGQCAQRAGLLNDAIQAWREVAERLAEQPAEQSSEQPQRDDARHSRMHAHIARIHRQLATAYELQGAWEQVMTARQTAAEAFAANAQPDEAAMERLLSAAHLRSAGRFRAALSLLVVARQEVTAGERWDLQARIMGLEGNVRARMGEFEAGLRLAQAALALALEHDLGAPTAEVYQRLADVFEHTEDYTAAKATYQTAFDFCQRNSAPTVGQICMACLTAVLFHTGEWEQALVICRQVLSSSESPPHALTVANTISGLIYALRGQVSRARPLLLDGAAMSRRIELVACELYSSWGQAILDLYNGAVESATEHCRLLIQRWQQVEDRHYAISPLRWAAMHFARVSAGPETRACASALTTLAAATGQPETLAALAHALGEVHTLDGDPEQAVQQFTQALQLLQRADSPLERAITHLQVGNALAALDQREAASEHWVLAYRAAEKLEAKPLADQAAQALAALGEKMDRRLGRRAAGKLQQGGLTRRQTEILQLVAQGQTNVEIARALSLSPRTVEMHVADILLRLDSHTRTEAVRKASETGLLKNTVGSP